MIDKCFACPFGCGVDRVTKFGRCNAGREMVIRAALPHFFEEPPVSGTRGSGTIFFAGCALHCVYCQNVQISKKADGKTVSAQALADVFLKLEEQKVHNINLVTPTHFTNEIVKALEIYRPSVPIVWNTSGYETEENIVRLLPYVDIFLTDMKYADKQLAKEYSGCADYPEVAARAIDKMVAEKPLLYDGALLKQGVIVRHLVLPSALKNTEGVIEMFCTRWKRDALLSLMGQFTPNGDNRFAALNRPLKPIEYRIAVRYAEKLGLNDFFIQEKGSVGTEYVPDFDKMI